MKDEPGVLSQTDINAITGQNMNVTITASDPNGFSTVRANQFQTFPSWIDEDTDIDISGNTITIDATPPTAGVYTIDFNILDYQGNITIETVTITVTDDNPTSFDKTNIPATINKPLTDVITVTDLDGVSTIEITNLAALPAWLQSSIQTAGNVILINNATPDAVGPVDIEVTVTDTNGVQTVETITIDVQYDSWRNKLIPATIQDDYPSVGMATGILEDPLSYMGITYEAGTQITFIENTGQGDEVLVRATPIVDKQIGNYTYEQGFAIDFYSNGQVQEGIVAQDTQLVAGFIVPQGSRVYFDNTGTLIEIDLSQNTSIFTRTYPASSTVYVDPTFALDKVLLSQDTTLDSYTYAAGTEVTFHTPLNYIESGFLANDTTIYGITYHAGDKLNLDTNEDVLTIELNSPLTIGGMTFPAGDLVTINHSATWNNNPVAEITSSQQHNIDGVDFPVGSIYKFGTPFDDMSMLYEIEFTGTITTTSGIEFQNYVRINDIQYSFYTSFKKITEGILVSDYTSAAPTIPAGITFQAGTELQIDGL
ncbi:hypothetical protein ACFL56_03905, partial [Candidatus Margulisiibacteriota bacterium]